MSATVVDWPEGWRVDRTGDVATVLIAGDLDLAAEEPLISGVGSLISSGCRLVVVDLGGVEFVDSSGVRSLLRLRSRHGGRLALGEVSGPAQRLFEIAGVGKVLQPEASEAERGDESR